MRLIQTIASALLWLLAFGPPALSGQQSAVVTEVGWLGLYNSQLMDWLESENQLRELCGAPDGGAEWQRCRAEKLAPRRLSVRLRSGPSDQATAVGSLLIVGGESTALSALETAWLRSLQPSGIILFRRNIETSAQLHALWQQTASALTAPFFRCVDLEGGTVDRLRDLVGPTPSAAEVGATNQPAIFRAGGALVGRMLHALGFNLNLAPVLDLALPVSRGVMGTRVVAADPAKVIAYAREFIAGLQQHGVSACGKHFPGLGGGTLDSHHATPSIGRTWTEIWEQDLEPYRALRAELPLVMVNHAAYPKIERPSRPASLSNFWIHEVLRG